MFIMHPAGYAIDQPAEEPDHVSESTSQDIISVREPVVQQQSKQIPGLSLLPTECEEARSPVLSPHPAASDSGKQQTESTDSRQHKRGGQEAGLDSEQQSPKRLKTSNNAQPLPEENQMQIAVVSEVRCTPRSIIDTLQLRFQDVINNVQEIVRDEAERLAATQTTLLLQSVGEKEDKILKLESQSLREKEDCQKLEDGNRQLTQNLKSAEETSKSLQGSKKSLEDEKQAHKLTTQKLINQKQEIKNLTAGLLKCKNAIDDSEKKYLQTKNELEHVKTTHKNCKANSSQLLAAHQSYLQERSYLQSELKRLNTAVQPLRDSNVEIFRLLNNEKRAHGQSLAKLRDFNMADLKMTSEIDRLRSEGKRVQKLFDDCAIARQSQDKLIKQLNKNVANESQKYKMLEEAKSKEIWRLQAKIKLSEDDRKAAEIAVKIKAGNEEHLREEIKSLDRQVLETVQHRDRLVNEMADVKKRMKDIARQHDESEEKIIGLIDEKRQAEISSEQRIETLKDEKLQLETKVRQLDEMLQRKGVLLDEANMLLNRTLASKSEEVNNIREDLDIALDEKLQSEQRANELQKMLRNNETSLAEAMGRLAAAKIALGSS